MKLNNNKILLVTITVLILVSLAYLFLKASCNDTILFVPKGEKVGFNLVDTSYYTNGKHEENNFFNLIKFATREEAATSCVYSKLGF
jgi:hypothetical protein